MHVIDKGVESVPRGSHVQYMHPDRRLDEYAARQYGAFSLSQARTVGMTPKMVETRRTNGAWIRLAPSVYVLASAPPKWERQMAAALLTRPGSIVAGRSAAYLHGFPNFHPGRPVIMVGATGNARSPLAQVIRCNHFRSITPVRLRGFMTTDEAVTIVTLARDLTASHLETLIDEVLARGSCSIAEIRNVMDAWASAPGLKKLRPIVAERSEDAYQPPTSELERHLYRLADHPAIPETSRQMPFQFRTVKATVDLYIPAWRLIVEADGRGWHNRKADHDRDRLRDNEATAHGLAVLRFTWTMLTRTPNDCLQVLLRTGQIRSAS